MKWSGGGGGPGSDTTAIHEDVAGEVAGVALKATPVAADLLLIEDSAAADAKKRITIGSLPSGGTPTDLDIYNGLVKQDPLHSKTDYFEGASLDPKWEEWDVSGIMTVSQADGAVRLYQPSTPPADYAGIIQPAPADDRWCVTARLRLSARFTVNAIVGALMVGEDLSAATGAPSTGNFLNNMILFNTTGVRWEAAGYTNFQTFAVSYGAQETGLYQHIAYMRIYVDRIASEAVFLTSADGRTWLQYTAATIFPGATPISAVASIGISIANVSGLDSSLFCDMFRVDVTNDMFLPVGDNASGVFQAAAGPPTGAASGDLSGTYPGPAVAAVTETAGPTSLVLGAVPDGEVLRRSGATLIGHAPVVVCCPFAAKANDLGKFLLANGKTSDNDDTSKPKTRQPAPAAGTLTALSYQTQAGDATTTLKVHVNGVVQATVPLTNIAAGLGGVEVISVPVVDGDYIEIEYDAGTAPDEMSAQLSLEVT